ncbi:hypothetical protein POREN0001_1703 [Porphyromonas endodontalis ATCC 35406]|uniref:Uncharacterized protein n=1 Tax=Porphyromonas endodontalis (strain ATCC 35406 / DSM 24491 / JCM 8526 / CCUG 16442 / BCRC 14492 / NCTC 13058 / HG 370) TaxID=553175 RepID=C3JBG9_POREA|nr:hypothetical protein POREN0001_1703 [Porphyromonas endodontalis ATCC 35406]
MYLSSIKIFRSSVFSRTLERGKNKSAACKSNHFAADGRLTSVNME